ncbi:MAG: hypothetical protein LUI13_06050 [Lachnospiraceae bacterium]|nr:hypothetical protein [Lachnospiraceae bacterium]
MKKTAGMSLMLLIFLSLCLITFSLLSLSGATADSKLSQKSAERTTEYYTAVTAANKMLSEIDTQLAACLKEAEASEDPEQAYLDTCAQITVEGVGLTWAAGTLSFDIDITDTQYLHMELAIAWPETDTDTLYQITSQKVVSTQEWSADTSQNLYRINEDETE